MLLKHKQWYCASSANPILSRRSEYENSTLCKPNGKEPIFTRCVGNTIDADIVQYSERCRSYACVGLNGSETKIAKNQMLSE